MSRKISIKVERRTLLCAIVAMMVFEYYLTKDPNDSETHIGVIFGVSLNLFTILNVVEATLWFLIGGVFFYKGICHQSPSSSSLMAGIFLIFLSVTDLIEIQFGSPFSPAWLLGFNLICIAAMTVFLTMDFLTAKK